jgi:hypothetical protein
LISKADSSRNTQFVRKFMSVFSTYKPNCTAPQSSLDCFFRQNGNLLFSTKGCIRFS